MYKDGLIKSKVIDGKKFDLHHYSDTKQCYELVKEETRQYWRQRQRCAAVPNYDFESEAPWTLGEMLFNQTFDYGYSVLLMDGAFYGSAGLRKLDDTSTICLSRFFCKPSVKPYANLFILPFHIKISQELNYSSTKITLNRYNRHLLRYYTELLPKKKDSISKETYNYIKLFENKGVQKVNYVDQIVLEYDWGKQCRNSIDLF